MLLDSPLDDRALCLAKSLLLVSASSMRDVNGELCLDCDVVLERDIVHLSKRDICDEIMPCARTARAAAEPHLDIVKGPLAEKLDIGRDGHSGVKKKETRGLEVRRRV